TRALVGRALLAALGVAGAPANAATQASGFDITPSSGVPAAPNTDSLLRAVRTHLDRGWGAADEKERVRHYREAEALAREAVERTPRDPDARWWLVASLGLRAQEESIGARIRLGRALHGEALALLEMAPDHPGGHHAMGRLHAGVLRRGRLARWLVKAMGGDEILKEASWERAEGHLRRAVELEPDAPHHRVELARILEARGREDEARTMARSALAASDEAPLASWYKGWAREILARLE
nr:hypothetical protein [Gemmatimonadota bacterium]NIU29522.1 hypothetical protein [Gemmatimonadota bacterium]NIU34569.1 hypothetical protein [Gemmatimonadota bacterium]NIV81500.1 hypothetical protein [Gemmatimonadota bacterium]NIW62586.1 hypothetical protein [Gemmatimonadota bacterium]